LPNSSLPDHIIFFVITVGGDKNDVACGMPCTEFFQELYSESGEMTRVDVMDVDDAWFGGFFFAAVFSFP